MAINPKPDWLSLQAAATLLGVHPSTVRLWSDKGILPTHRTSGGHRRYLRTEIDLWMDTSRNTHAPEPGSALQSAASQIRMRISEGRLEAEPWYQKLGPEARAQYRQSGETLMRTLLASLVSENSQNAGEAFALGYEYASRARRYELSSVEAVRAFLFFRNLLLEALINTYEAARVPPGQAWGRLLNRLHGFTDQVLISLLETCAALDGTRQQ